MPSPRDRCPSLCASDTSVSLENSWYGPGAVLNVATFEGSESGEDILLGVVNPQLLHGTVRKGYFKRIKIGPKLPS